MNAGHVLELQEPVRGERLVLLIGAAEPLEPLLHLRGVSGHSNEISSAYPVSSNSFARVGGLRVRLVRLIHVVENQRVGVVRRRGLLEAAVRLAEQAIEPLHEIGHRRRIHFEPDLERPRHHVLRQRHAAARLPFSSMSLNEPTPGKPSGTIVNRAKDGVLVGGRSCR